MIFQSLAQIDQTMSNLQHKKRLLRKVKRNNNGGATVEWTDIYFDPESGTYVKNTEARTSDAMIHEDMKSAFAPFAEHWMIFGEETPEPKANHAFDGSLKGLEKVTVTSVTLSGGGFDEEGTDDDKPIGVHIQGTKKLRCGRVKNYCCPGIKLGSPQEKYKFSADVDAHLAGAGGRGVAVPGGQVRSSGPGGTLNFDDAPDLGQGAVLELGEPV
jgi:hypothetical protein